AVAGSPGRVGRRRPARERGDEPVRRHQCAGHPARERLVGQQFKMLKQIQQMQAKMAKIQEELGEKTVTGTAGGGMVEVVANGHQKVLSVTVKPEVVDPADVEMLQDLVLAAVNDAMEKARELATREMGAVTAGMGLPPGLMG